MNLTEATQYFDARYALKNGNSDSKKLTHDELADIIPTNFGECPGGDCGHQTLKSNKFTNKLWECPECRDRYTRA